MASASTSDGKIFLNDKYFSTFFPFKNTCNFYEKTLKTEKNILFQFLSMSVFSKMFPHLIWDFQSYLGRKKGTSETFLSLGLFISWPRPMASASKMRPQLRKTFPRFPFFYFGNLDKSQIRRRQIFTQSSQHNFQNKILIVRLFLGQQEKKYQKTQLKLVCPLLKKSLNLKSDTTLLLQNLLLPLLSVNKIFLGCTTWE